MMQALGLLVLHGLCIYFLRLLWRDKKEALKRGRVFTKLGTVSRRKSPRLFSFSVWVDFIVLAALYLTLIVYSILLLWE
jgi:hypothetical protein